MRFLTKFSSETDSPFLSFLKSFGLPEYLFPRCMGVYFWFSAARVLSERRKNLHPVSEWTFFLADSSLVALLVSCLFGFAVLSLIYHVLKKSKPRFASVLDNVFLLLGTFGFSFAILWRYDDFYLMLGVFAVCAVFVCYAVRNLQAHGILHTLNSIKYDKFCIIVSLVFSLFVVVFISITAVCKHRTYNTSTYDMGIFVQTFYSLKEHLNAVTTCERSHALSHFRVHASYIFYLLVPLYSLFPSGDTLIAAQAVLAVSGVIPLILIAKKRGYSGLLLFVISGVYALNVGIISPCYSEFHENAFLPPLLMWLLFAVETGNLKLLYILSALTLIVKEDAPLYIICLGLYFFFEKKSKKRLHGLFISAAALVYFVFITNWLRQNGDGNMMLNSRFYYLSVDGNGDFAVIVSNILNDPAYFFSLFVQEHTLMFFIQALLPLLFVPLICRRIHRYLLVIPFVIMNLVIGSGYPQAAVMGYQYTFGPSCFLIYLFVVNSGGAKQHERECIAALSLLASFVTSVSLLTQNVYFYDSYRENKAYYDGIEACLDTIPEDASVVSDGTFLPHVANRDEIYAFDDDKLNELDYDFYVLRNSDEKTEQKLEDAGYTCFAQYESAVVIYKSPNYG